jgi:uncharacterized protein YybS (DUF2232 family)
MSSAPDQFAPFAGAGRALIPALVCAAISAVLMRSGFFSLLFLVPLGYAAVVYGRAAWLSFLAAMLLNLLFSVSLVFFAKGAGQGNFSAMWTGVLYYTVVAGAFTWIMLPESTTGFFHVRTLYRFIAGALAAAFVFLFIMYAPLNGSSFAEAFRPQAELLSSLYISSAGADAAKRSLLEQAINADMVLELMKLVAFRGGAVVSCFLLFFISRQLSLSIARVFRRAGSRQGTTVPGIAGFHAPPLSIWVLSASLALVLLSRIFNIGSIETAAWNVLVICGIIYLVQGAGIVLFFFSRRGMPPASRFFLNVLVVIIVLSPGINAFVFGAVLLLGIAENWLPLRAVKTNGSSSTPMV